MPKMKSNRSAVKRFRLTATGRIRRNQAYIRHILTKKTRKRKRQLRQRTLVAASDVQRIKRLIG
jgi:large subunit ribosomal protein L35